jgi:hypothetical protein
MQRQVLELRQGLNEVDANRLHAARRGVWIIGK